MINNYYKLFLISKLYKAADLLVVMSVQERPAKPYKREHSKSDYSDGDRKGTAQDSSASHFSITGMCVISSSEFDCVCIQYSCYDWIITVELTILSKS